MTLTSVDKNTGEPSNSPNFHHDDHNKNLTIAGFGELPLEVQTKWLTMRRELMAKMDWVVEDDFDRYDADPATRQILFHNDNDEIIAGMRLTPCGDIKDTLSWGMLPGLPEGDIEGLSGHQVWDLTRLVPGTDMSSENMQSSERMATLTQLFGAGLAACEASGDSDPCWVFTTYPWFARAFERYGMKFTPIPDTRRGGAMVFYAYPAQIKGFLADNTDKFSAASENAEMGFNLTDDEPLT